MTMDRDWKQHFQNRLDGAAGKLFKKNFPDSCLIPWFDALEIVEAVRIGEKSGRLVVRFTVTNPYLNPGGTLQGGLQTAMYDVISSWVFEFAKGWESTGSSRTLNVSYLRPAPLGEVLLMDCELIQAGKRLGMSRGVLKREKDGAFISLCEHHKYNAAGDQPKV